MDRKDEIKELLKSLLGKVENTIDDNQYGNRFDLIVESARGVVVLSGQIQEYLRELDSKKQPEVLIENEL